MHIAMSGRLGSGKSTCCKLLSEQYGYEIFSTGAIQREIALQRGISTLALNLLAARERGLDFMIDDAVARVSRERECEVVIFDSRMAWKFAQHAFKVFVTVDPAVAADRVMGAARGEEEKYADAGDARRQLVERARLENERFRQIYGVDNFDYGNYHLVLDATCAPPELLTRMIHEKFQAFCAAASAAGESARPGDILLSPTSLFPTRGPVDRAALPALMEERKYRRDPIAIAVLDGYHYIVDGHCRALAAILNGEAFVEVRMAPMTTPRQPDAGVIHAFEAAGGFRYASYPF